MPRKYQHAATCASGLVARAKMATFFLNKTKLRNRDINQPSSETMTMISNSDLDQNVF